MQGSLSEDLKIRGSNCSSLTTVRQVFANVATKYDVMNDVMSGGIHRLWKDHFIRTLAPTPGTKLLDVAGGTGDIAMRFLDYCKETHGDNSAQVTIFDINPNMLEVGKERFSKTPYHNSNVPFPSFFVCVCVCVCVQRFRVCFFFTGD